jgi:integrase
VKHLLVTLRGAIDLAVKDGLIVRNVAALVNAPRITRKDMRTFEPEQERRFIETVRGYSLEALFTVAASVGLTQGEALGLRLVDLDLEYGTLMVRSALQRVTGKLITVELKSATSTRPITLPAIAVSALAAHLTRREQDQQIAGTAWIETGYVFTTTVGTPIDPRAVIRRFHAILKANDLASFGSMTCGTALQRCSWLKMCPRIHCRVAGAFAGFIHDADLCTRDEKRTEAMAQRADEIFGGGASSFATSFATNRPTKAVLNRNLLLI